jgi:polysaccharide pyruvyl transferase CsaB
MKDNKKQKILISGYYGHGNIGDEAILFSILDQLKGHDLTVVSLDPEYTKRVQGQKAIDFFNTDEVEEAVKRSDIVVMGGGGIFQEFPDIDYYKTRISYLFHNPYGKLLAFAIVPIISAIYEKPLVFLGQGVGSFFSEDSKSFYRFIFSLPSLITVRDNYSYGWVKQLGRHDGIHLSADPAFLLLAEDGEKADSLLKKHTLTEKKFITLSLREWIYHGLIDDMVREVARALNDFLRDKELSVLLIPFQEIEKNAHPTQDKKTLLQLMERLEKNIQEKAVLLEDNLRPQELQALMGKGLFGIGMRYHFLIFSVLNSIPSVSLSYDEKCLHLMREIGLEDLSVKGSEMSYQVLLSRMNRLFHHLDEYREILVQNVPQMKERAARSFSLLHHIETKEPVDNIGLYEGDGKIEALEELRNALFYKDETIRDLKEELKAELHDKGKIIDQLKSELYDKKRIAEELQSELSRNQEILEEKERTSRELDSQLSQAWTALNAIHSSKTWRIGQFYGRLFGREATWRRKISGFLRKRGYEGAVRGVDGGPLPLTEQQQIREGKEQLNPQRQRGDIFYFLCSAFP